MSDIYFIDTSCDQNADSLPAEVNADSHDGAADYSQDTTTEIKTPLQLSICFVLPSHGPYAELNRSLNRSSRFHSRTWCNHSVRRHPKPSPQPKTQFSRRRH